MINIDLTGDWISSFIQNNKIYNEKITFKQKKNKVTAKIILNYEYKTYNYNLQVTLLKIT